MKKKQKIYERTRKRGLLIYLDDAEMNKVKVSAKAGKLSVNQYARIKLLDGDLNIIPESDKLDTLISEQSYLFDNLSSVSAESKLQILLLNKISETLIAQKEEKKDGEKL
jgi:hypothetical protein